jgi:hypothetical protein
MVRWKNREANKIRYPVAPYLIATLCMGLIGATSAPQTSFNLARQIAFLQAQNQTSQGACHLLGRKAKMNPVDHTRFCHDSRRETRTR